MDRRRKLSDAQLVPKLPFVAIVDIQRSQRQSHARVLAERPPDVALPLQEIRGEYGLVSYALVLSEDCSSNGSLLLPLVCTSRTASNLNSLVKVRCVFGIVLFPFCGVVYSNFVSSTKPVLPQSWEIVCLKRRKEDFW